MSSYASSDNVCMDFCPFKSLGVDPGCSKEDVRAAWVVFHQANSSEETLQFQRAKLSFETLLDDFNRHFFQNARNTGVSLENAWKVVNRRRGHIYHFTNFNPLQTPRRRPREYSRHECDEVPDEKNFTVDDKNDVSKQTKREELDRAADIIPKNETADELGGKPKEETGIENSECDDVRGILNAQLEGDRGSEPVEKVPTIVSRLQELMKHEEAMAAAGQGWMIRRRSSKRQSASVGKEVQPTLEKRSAKKYPCTHCPKGYSRNGLLKKHMNNHHGINSVAGKKTDFICNECQKAFSRKDALKRHRVFMHNYEAKK